MASRLYVGGLSAGVTEDGLVTLFAMEGTVVSVEMARDEKTGASKGYAYIEMGSDEEAFRALNKLHGAKFDGDIIVISAIKSKKPEKAA